MKTGADRPKAIAAGLPRASSRVGDVREGALAGDTVVTPADKWDWLVRLAASVGALSTESDCEYLSADLLRGAL